MEGSHQPKPIVVQFPFIALMRRRRGREITMIITIVITMRWSSIMKNGL